MSQNNPGGEDRVDRQEGRGPFEDYQVDGERAQEMAWLGRVDREERTETVGYIFHRDTEMIHEAVLDPETEEWVPDLESGRELAPEETLGEAVEDIGERLGWESLSAFADEHLSDGGGSDGDGESGRD